jgi:SAM-dependent methyltransferase
VGKDLSDRVDDFAGRSEIARSYDLVASEYLAAFGDELSGKPEDRRLLGLVAECGGLVADVGSGPGHVSTFLRSHGAATVAVDAAAGMAALAGRDRHPALTADMRLLPFAPASLDAVVAFYSLIHLPRGDVPTALREFARCLRREALLLVAVHAGEGVTGGTEFLGRDVRLTATLFGLGEMVAMVAGAGFEIVESLQRPPCGNEGTQRIYVLARRVPTSDRS